MSEEQKVYLVTIAMAVCAFPMAYIIVQISDAISGRNRRRKIRKIMKDYLDDPFGD